MVGSTPIFRSALEEQVEAEAMQLRIEKADTAAYNQLHRDVLNGLIDQELLLLEADARNLRAADEEIDAEVDRVIQANIRQLGGETEFRAQLARENLTEAALRARYRDEVRRRIVTQRLISQEIQPKVVVTDEMARTFFEANRSQLPKKPRSLRLRDLFVQIRPDTILSQRARETALDVRSKITGGTLSFEEAAARYSDDPRGKEGGVLGRVERGRLAQFGAELEATAFALQAGELSGPVQSPYGYHLLKADDKDPNGEWVDLRHLLIGVTPSRVDEADAFDRATDLRARIASGALDFVEAIRRHSDQPGAPENEGDLGWIPIDAFDGEMRAVVDTIRVGRLSPPVPVEGGFHIFMVLGEQAEATYTYDEVAEEMKQYAGRQAMDEELQAWLTELRAKHHVDVRARH